MKDLDLFIKGRGEVRGFVFHQLFRSPFAYMYKKHELCSGSVTYEVFRRVENVVYSCVSYPRSSGFGGSIYKAKEFSDYNLAFSWFCHLSHPF